MNFPIYTAMKVFIKPGHIHSLVFTLAASYTLPFTDSSSAQRKKGLLGLLDLRVEF